MTFDSGEFSGKINDLLSKLGELAGLDRCIEYINDLNSGKATMVPRPGQIYEGGSPAGRQQTVTLGTTYPFQMTAHIVDSYVKQGGKLSQSTDAGGGTVAQFEDDLENLMNLGSADTDPYVIRFNLTTTDIQYGTPADFQTISKAFTDDITPPLQTLISENFALLESTLDSWTGVAKSEFEDVVYTQTKQMAANQAYLADAIGVLVGGAKVIVDLGQNSLDSTVSAALKAVDEQLKQRHDAHQSTGTSAFEILALGAAVAGFLAVVTLPVVPLSGALTAGSVGLTYASTRVPPPSEEKGEQIKADSAAKICSELDRVREKVLAHWDTHWAALQKEATTVRSHISDAESTHLLYPPVTSLERSVPGPGQFGPAD